MTNVDWFKWRPVLDGIATLQEIDTHWSICDLADAHEALDIRSEAEEFYREKARREAEQNRGK